MQMLVYGRHVGPNLSSELQENSIFLSLWMIFNQSFIRSLKISTDESGIL